MKMDTLGVLTSCPQCSSRNRIPFRSIGQETRCGHCKTPLSPPNEPVEVGGSEQFDALTRECPLPVFVDFWAEWCGPCKMLAPELQKVGRSAAGRVLVAKVNTEEVSDVAARYRISSIPTMVLVRNGQEVGRVSGAQPAQNILSFLRSQLGGGW
jgi:thioredoxin 2